MVRSLLSWLSFKDLFKLSNLSKIHTKLMIEHCIANALEENICCITKPFDVYQSIVTWKLLKITLRDRSSDPAEQHNVEISIDQAEDRFCSIDHLPRRRVVCGKPFLDLRTFTCEWLPTIHDERCTNNTNERVHWLFHLSRIFTNNTLN